MLRRRQCNRGRLGQGLAVRRRVLPGGSAPRHLPRRRRFPGGAELWHHRRSVKGAELREVLRQEHVLPWGHAAAAHLPGPPAHARPLPGLPPCAREHVRNAWAPVTWRHRRNIDVWRALLQPIGERALLHREVSCSRTRRHQDRSCKQRTGHERHGRHRRVGLTYAYRGRRRLLRKKVYGEPFLRDQHPARGRLPQSCGHQPRRYRGL
mmetsp:Transcript_92667/g.232975  ORF Transcript_92667/g.232975 Transcript_92667/m.232975 type:complete len:208 (-) Transcript_92667:307-930(-)